MKFVKIEKLKRVIPQSVRLVVEVILSSFLRH